MQCTGFSRVCVLAGFWFPKQQLFSSSSYSPTVMDGHTSRVYALTFFPENDERFISGGWDDTVQVMGSVMWEVEGLGEVGGKMSVGGAELLGNVQCEYSGPAPEGVGSSNC